MCFIIKQFKSFLLFNKKQKKNRGLVTQQIRDSFLNVYL